MQSMKEDNLITRAIIGTGQYAGETLATRTTADALLASIEVNDERKLLLTAGTSAIYQRAGYTSLTNLPLPEPAPPETLPVCQSGITPLLQQVLERAFGDDTTWLLTEAAEIMQQRHLILPHELLPLALTYSPRTIVPSILGERGR